MTLLKQINRRWSILNSALAVRVLIVMLLPIRLSYRKYQSSIFTHNNLILLWKSAFWSKHNQNITTHSWYSCSDTKLKLDKKIT